MGTGGKHRVLAPLCGLGELRQQIQTNLYDTLPGELMTATAFEADELYQNAGEKKYAPSQPCRPTAPARQ